MENVRILILNYHQTIVQQIFFFRFRYKSATGVGFHCEGALINKDYVLTGNFYMFDIFNCYC